MAAASTASNGQVQAVAVEEEVFVMGEQQKKKVVVVGGGWAGELDHQMPLASLAIWLAAGSFPV